MLTKIGEAAKAAVVLPAGLYAMAHANPASHPGRRRRTYDDRYYRDRRYYDYDYHYDRRRDEAHDENILFYVLVSMLLFIFQKQEENKKDAG